MPRVYTGRDCGKVIEPLLRKARKRIWIVTPYLSEDYASILVSKAREGVDIRVLVVDLSENRKAIRLLGQVPKPRIRVFPLRLALLIAMMTLVLYVFTLLAPGSVSYLVFVSIALYALEAASELLLFLRSWSVWLGVTGASIGLLYIAGVSITLQNAIRIHVALATLVLLIICVIDLVYARRRPPIPRVHLRIVPKSKFVHSKIYIIDDVGIIGSANLTRAGLWHNMETIAIFTDKELNEIEEAFNTAWKSVES